MRKVASSLLLIVLISCGASKNLVVDSTPPPPPKPEISLAEIPESKKELDPIQEKYGPILNVKPEKLENIELYKFLDRWMGTPYLMGGENENGIDCSAFTQRLYVEVYDYLPERTANKQYGSESTRKFLGQEFLKEGDMLFFKRPKSRSKDITHVGIYLENNKFVSASGFKGPEKFRGVKISDLSDPWWQERFVCAGRKPLSIHQEKE